MSNTIITLIGALGVVIDAAAPVAAQDVLTMHRLSAALASEAVTEAVATCGKQGYRVAATIIDTDGVTQAMLRGDGAGLIAVNSSYDKAYTVIMIGATSNEDFERRHRETHWADAACQRHCQVQPRGITARRIAYQTRQRGNRRDWRRRRPGRRSRRSVC